MKHLSPKTYHLKPNLSGFTLLELLIFVAIFVIIITSFIAVLISVLRVQNRETSVIEVNRQSQFVMNTIQRYVEESSMISINEKFENGLSATSSQLVLRMASSSDSFSNAALTRIYFSSSTGAVYLQEGYDYSTNPPRYLGALQPLTSDRVVVDKLEFKKRATPGGHDSVDIVLALHYNSPNIQRQFTQALQTSVARINAATFDSDIMPSSTLSSLNIGSPGSPWKSINGIISFSNSNVGIGNTSPNYTLDVGGSFHISNGSGNMYFTGGNLGINVSNPPYPLTVNGNIRLYGGTGFSCTVDSVGIISFLAGRLVICVLTGGSYQTLFITATSTASY